MNDKEKIQVYYNSACPVCNAGISAQKAKMENCPVEWQDVHLNNSAVEKIAAELEFVRERLHVIDEQRKLNIGLDAFIAIWRNSPKEKWKARLFALPIVRPLSANAYNLFAALLYRWNRAKKHW